MIQTQLVHMLIRTCKTCTCSRSNNCQEKGVGTVILGKFIEDFKTKNPKITDSINWPFFGFASDIECCGISCKKESKSKAYWKAFTFLEHQLLRMFHPAKKYGKLLQNVINKKIINYYAPSDDVGKMGR